MHRAAAIRAARGGRSVRIVRETLGPGRLGGLIVRRGRTAAVLAADVPGPMVAGAVRHLLEDHDVIDGASLCVRPLCGAWSDWRPALAATDRAATGS